jgi:glutathione synthase
MKGKKYKLLIITDHNTHTKENSLYALAQALKEHRSCKFVDVVSRSTKKNSSFFEKNKNQEIFVVPIEKRFTFSDDHKKFTNPKKKSCIENYDIIYLRLPHPVHPHFFRSFTKITKKKIVINNPATLRECGSKAYLLHFPNICPPMKLCRRFNDLLSFAANFPIVLKPLESHGGKDIVKIEENTVFQGNKKSSITKFKKKWEQKKEPLLAMKFVDNISAGDKRVNVVNEKIICATLRTPAPGKWLCNVSQGGSSTLSDVTKQEKVIARELSKSLSKKGIIIYGFDTLEDNGRRVLSEINVMSIGGFMQADVMSGKPILKKTAAAFWKYVNKKSKE